MTCWPGATVSVFEAPANVTALESKRTLQRVTVPERLMVSCFLVVGMAPRRLRIRDRVHAIALDKGAANHAHAANRCTTRNFSAFDEALTGSMRWPSTGGDLDVRKEVERHLLV